MNLGDVKGAIADRAINETQPKLLMELGGYCGYSAVRFGRLLRQWPGACIFSIEFNPEFAAIARQIIQFAGLGEWSKINLIFADFNLCVAD